MPQRLYNQYFAISPLGAEMAVARLTFAAKLRRSQRNDSYSKTSIR